MKKEQIVARLTINGLPEMTDKQYIRLLAWLEALSEEFQKAYLKDYSKKYTAKLYK